jgi:hypothetical protein
VLTSSYGIGQKGKCSPAVGSITNQTTVTKLFLNLVEGSIIENVNNVVGGSKEIAQQMIDRSKGIKKMGGSFDHVLRTFFIQIFIKQVGGNM